MSENVHLPITCYMVNMWQHSSYNTHNNPNSYYIFVFTLYIKNLYLTVVKQFCPEWQWPVESRTADLEQHIALPQKKTLMQMCFVLL